jgi:hypothetical protein
MVTLRATVYHNATRANGKNIAGIESLVFSLAIVRPR